MDNITAKFIDFGLDDGHSSYGNEAGDKQEKLRRFFQESQFNFETKCLDLPAGKEDIEDDLIPDMTSLSAMQTADSEMGKDLDDIFEIMNKQARSELKSESIIIEHRWNFKKGSFDR